MTRRMTPREIARTLRVSESGLEMLVRAVANNGVAGGRGFGTGAGMTREGLLRRGYLEGAYVAEKVGGTVLNPVYKVRYPTITEAGRDLVKRARAMGF